METAAVATRERRKRVHSTKCPCCSHEQGKPELKARQSRKRKGDEIKAQGTPLLKTKRSSKGKKAANLKSTDTEICSFDIKEDENSTAEGRILRSGRSTPVCIETSSDKEKPVPKRKAKLSKLIKQESGTEPIKQKTADTDDAKSYLSGIKQEDDFSSLDEKNVTTPSNNAKAKAKTKKQQNKAGNPRPKSFTKSGTAKGNAQQKGAKVCKPKGAPKSGKQKLQVNSSKVTKNKRSQVSKTKDSNATATAGGPKKTSAIEKLKVRAFDQLKEKLEIAFDRNSISVPECAQLLQQITSPNLSEIFYSQPASVDDRSSESLVAGLAGKSLPEIMTEGMQRSGNLTNIKEMAVAEKPTTMETAVAENLSKAAQALVSFKSQTASSRMNLYQEAPSSDEFSNSNTPITQALLNDNFGFQNANNLTDTGFPVSDPKFVKNSMGNQFDGAMSIQRQTVNNFPNTTAFGQAKSGEEILKSTTTQSIVGVQPTSNQEIQQSNLPQPVSYGLVVSSDPLVKTTITESSNHLLPTTNQLLQTTNPLVPTTNQLLQMTNRLTSTTSQVLQRINSLIPTTNQVAPVTNPLIPTVNQLFQTNAFLPTTNPLIPTTNQLLTNVSGIATSTSKTDATLVAISPGLPVLQAPNVLMNQPQVAFQFLQTQRTNSTLPTVMTTTQTQSTQRFICPNPATLPRNATLDQQPTTLLPLNQRLFLPKMTPPIDQKTLGSNLPTLLPGIKHPHDLLLSKTGSTVTPRVTGALPITSTNEIPSSYKLRPILPREPLVSPTFALFNPPQQSLHNVAKATDISSNVKQAVKRLVNGRTRTTGNPSAQQTTSLPDIASTFNKALFTANTHGKPMLAPAQNRQYYSEMANKEQAIKALLSIGGEQQTARQATKGTTNVAASKLTEMKKPDDLLVVFDTDKGIFKVDDVTIDPQVNTIGKESYTCGKCGKIFTSLSYLARHIKRVCPDMTHRKWKCDLCEKAFRHPFGLQQHVFTHTGERPHKCQQCPKAFYSSNDLRRHSRIHSGERPYNCKHCGKTFATTISLKTHTFIHTGEKPHRCPHCPKTFATSSKLGRHIVTHSEQRPFACTQCPKTFNRSGDLRRHNLNLHEGKHPVEEKPDTKKILNVSEDLISNITEQKIDSGIPT